MDSQPSLWVGLNKGWAALGLFAFAACGGGGSSPSSDAVASVDLTIPHLASADITWGHGERLAVDFMVTNQGSGSSSATVAGLYISTDNQIGMTDTLLARVPVASLAAGGSVSVLHEITFDRFDTGLPLGSYYIGIVADVDGGVTETAEHNNASATPIQIQVMASGDSAPDGVTSIDASYGGRWGWRGAGVDGPRGVAVAPWGVGGEVTDWDTLESRQFTVDGDGMGAIGARDAYALGLDGSGVVVAVVGTNMNRTHGEFSDGTFVGYYDATIGGALDTDDQGTHAAGIIAGSYDGGTANTHGVAHGASLVGIAIGDSRGEAIDLGALATAVDAATAQGARIFANTWAADVNTSASTSALDNTAYRASVADAIDKGAVFIWAAGDSFSANQALGDQNTSEEAKAAVKYEELANGFINVVNMRYDATLNSGAGGWEIANETTGDSGPNSQICGVTQDFCLGAPGTLVGSALADGTYGYETGSAMAAATVAGGMAILFQAFPYVETEDILQLMLTTAQDLGAAGVDEVYGHGMMDLAAALAPVGSLAIPTAATVHENEGIALSQTSLSAAAPFADAVSRATTNLIGLDSFDRAYTLGGEAFISTEAPQSISADIEMPEAGFSMTMNAQSAEVSLSAVKEQGPWRLGQTVGLAHEQDQVFGYSGGGAFDLADNASTLSVGASAERTFGTVRIGGTLGISQTYLNEAGRGLIDLGDDMTAVSFQIGGEITNLGTQETGRLGLSLSQERRVISSHAELRTPMGREEGGVIRFETQRLENQALGTEAVLAMRYEDQFSGLDGTEPAKYSLSLSTQESETTVNAELTRAF